MFIKLSHATLCLSLCPYPWWVVFAPTTPFCIKVSVHAVPFARNLSHMAFPMPAFSTPPSCAQVSSLQGNLWETHGIHQAPLPSMLPSCLAQLYFPSRHLSLSSVPLMHTLAHCLFPSLSVISATTGALSLLLSPMNSAYLAWSNLLRKLVEWNSEWTNGLYSDSHLGKRPWRICMNTCELHWAWRWSLGWAGNLMSTLESHFSDS